MTTEAAAELIGQAPERWQKALERADKEGVQVVVINVTGQWVASSGTKPGMGYQLALKDGELTCSCAASNWDGLCKHKARWMAMHGLMAKQAQA
ncbi:MAG: hypothetical protein QM692_21250 [Thermomicrobiales bacterium]